MIVGVITSTIMELMVYPAIFYVWCSRKLRAEAPTEPKPEKKEVYA